MADKLKPKQPILPPLGPRRPYGFGLPKKKGRNLSPRHKEAEQEYLDKLIRDAKERMAKGEAREASRAVSGRIEEPVRKAPGSPEEPSKRPDPTPGTPKAPEPQESPSRALSEKARQEVLEEMRKKKREKYDDASLTDFED